MRYLTQLTSAPSVRLGPFDPPWTGGQVPNINGWMFPHAWKALTEKKE